MDNGTVEMLDTAVVQSEGAAAEHQTPRDIRQWAICEASRHQSNADDIMWTARRFVAFVETGTDFGQTQITEYPA